MNEFNWKFVVRGDQETSCKNKEERIFLPISFHDALMLLLALR
jgi:hypothetical protein